MHLDATEHGESLVFLHAVREGPASRSYGLQVAQLAGVPREIIAAARRTLALLEARSAHAGLGEFTAGRAALRRSAAAEAPADPRAGDLLRRLAALDPDTLTPRAALELLYDLHRQARD